MVSAVRVATIVFVLQIAVLLATGALFAHFGGSVRDEINHQDAREYMLLGDALLSDGQFHLPGSAVPETWRTPAYPAFVAVVFALTNHSLDVLLVLLALVGAATSGLIYLIGRELSLSHRFSQAAGILFGVSPAVIWIPPSGMGGDIVFIFLFTGAVYLLLRIETADQRWRPALMMGLVLGLATLTRPIGLYLSVLVFAALPFFVSRKILHVMLVAILGFALVITPWCLRNEVVAHHFSLSSQFAFNPFYYNIPLFYAWQHHTNEEAERNKLMDSVGTHDVYALVNGFTYSSGLQTIDKQFLAQNLFPYLYFHAIKTIPFFVGSGVNVIYATITNEIPTMPDVPFFPRAAENTASLFYGGSYSAVLTNLLYYWPATLERVLWLIMFILAFAAPVVTHGRARRFALLGLLLILAIAALASPIAQPRYRIPAEPFIWLSAAFMIEHLTLKMRRGIIKKEETN